VVIGNVGRLRGGIQLLPDAQPDDGLLDAAVLAPRSVLGWLPILARLAARPRGSTDSIRRYRGRRINVRTRRPAPREIDGEMLAPGRGLAVAVEPGALVIRVAPAQSVHRLPGVLEV
jgi:undecaprenyl-diphosphatase